MNDLKCLPLRAGGGLDWRLTLATIKGWVHIVANDFDSAPRTGERLVDDDRRMR